MSRYEVRRSRDSDSGNYNRTYDDIWTAKRGEEKVPIVEREGNIVDRESERERVYL